VQLIQRDRNQLCFQNDWIRRVIDTAEQPHTTLFSLRPNGRQGADIWVPTFWPGFYQPYEALIRMGGRDWAVGPMTRGPGQGGTEVTGHFRVAQIDIEATPIGEAALVRCLPRFNDVPPLEITLRYEIAADLPLLIKQVIVTNRGPQPIRIDNVTVDAFMWARYAKELRVFTDFYDFYGESLAKDQIYQGWLRREFPSAINFELEPGAELRSFRCFECATPNDAESFGLLRAAVVHRLAPWTTRPLLSQEIDTAPSLEDLMAVAPQAAANGIELCHLFINQLFTNCGDYIPRPDFFPNGTDDLKRLTDHFHRHKVKVVPYCSLTVAWQPIAGPKVAKVCLEHENWQYLGPEGVRYNCYGFGNMCYQSDWGLYIKGKLNSLVDDLGFDGLHIDGPYHGLPCLDPTHRHRSPESVFFMNWQFERELYAQWRAKDIFFSVPQDPASILLGANANPGGYSEEDHASMGGIALVSATRALLYDARYQMPASCAWAYHALDLLHGHSIEASDTDPLTYEHSLAGVLANGYWGMLRGRNLFIGPRTEAIFHKWIRFYREHRATFCGGHVHLVRPDGSHPDAMLHVNPAAPVPAVLTAFNPSQQAACLILALPLYRAGFSGNSHPLLEGQGPLDLDSRGTATVTLRLEPGEVCALEICKEEG